jgi:hypothetical protein
MYPYTLPFKFDGNWINLFRDPGALKPRECHNVIGTGRYRADFILLMREE